MNPSRLTRRLVAGAAGLALGVAATLALASPASAHHTEIVGTPECVTETGEWLVTWTVNSAETPAGVEQFQLTAVAHEPAESTLTGFTLNVDQSIAEPFTGEQRLPGDATSAALTVDAKWDNGHTNQSVSDPVTFDGTCDKDEKPPMDEELGEFTFDCETLKITFTNPTEEELTVTFLPSTGDAVELKVAPGETGEASFTASEGLSVAVQINGEDVELEEPIEITSEEWAELNCDEDGGEGGGDDDEPALPLTGSSTMLIAGGALALLALGGGMYLVARRRRVSFIA